MVILRKRLIVRRPGLRPSRCSLSRRSPARTPAPARSSCSAAGGWSSCTRTATTGRRRSSGRSSTGDGTCPCARPDDVWIDPGHARAARGHDADGTLVRGGFAHRRHAAGLSPLEAGRDRGGRPSASTARRSSSSASRAGPTWSQPDNPVAPAGRTVMFGTRPRHARSAQYYRSRPTAGRFHGTVFGPVTIPGVRPRAATPNGPLYTWLQRGGGQARPGFVRRSRTSTS